MSLARLVLPCALAALAAGAPAAALAAKPPSRGIAFTPTPVTERVYDIKEPAENPGAQRHVVEAHDGVDLYVESWIPKAKGGRTPPAKVPVVIVMTPYVTQGVTRNEPLIEELVTRGYAVMQAHVRGTGESGGCLEQTGPNQIDDGARVVEYAGRDAPFSNGHVAMFGKSYDAEAQIGSAGLGDPAKLKWLDTIVPVSSVGGQYEYSHFDGVPYLGQAIASNAAYLATTSLIPGETTTPVHMAEKLLCQPELFAGSADQSGNMTPFWSSRELRPGVSRIKQPILYVHGLLDFNVKPITLAGFFERIPAGVPKAAILGQWAHVYPHETGAVAEWARNDWFPTVVAWLDRYLMGLPSGVESWPTVQVQDMTGQWRAEPDFPFTGGPAGHLALGTGGRLGESAPSGSTQYTEGPNESGTVAGTRAVFETAPLAGDLHLTGQPVLDAWISLDRPDAHVSAKLERITPEGAVANPAVTYGHRSMQHLDPLVDNRFAQSSAKLPAIGTPIRVPLRFLPTDMRLPKGWKLRLTVAGSVDGSEPSGTATRVTIHHDCTHASALRFVTPDPGAPLLDVREIGDRAALGTDPVPVGVSDGGGLARAAVCGKEPERLANFGPVRAPWAPPGSAPPPAAPGATPAPRPSTRRAPLALRVLRVARRGRTVRVTVRSRRGPVRQVTAVLRRTRTGKPLAVLSRRTTVRGTRTLVLRVRRGARIRRGRHFLALAGVNPGGAKTALTVRPRVR